MGCGGHSSRAGQEGEKGPVPSTCEPCCPAQASRLPDHGGTVFLSLFTALWAVLLLEADERLLAGRWGCWDSGDLELGGPPTRPCPSTHPFKHRPPTTPGAALAPVFHLSSHNNPEPHHH